MQECWYRYDYYLTAPAVDEFERRCGESTVHLRLQHYEVLRHTPKGVWLLLPDGYKRFVLREVNRRFACPTKEEALESFLARKRRQRTIYRTRIRHIEAAMNLAARNEVEECALW